MSEYNLGTARGTIEIDYKGQGVDQATAGLGKASKSAESSEAAVRKVGTGFTVAGAAIAAGLGVAINSAADFEKGLSGIQAVSGATQSEMDQVRKKALQLGADTAFSASDASAAIEELVKAGISIPDVMNGAADATVALAAAGGVALPEAATIASNAMNQFGLAAEDMPNIANKIAGAANASAIDVSDFGQSMQQAGAVAHLAGLNFDDTALAITAMGNAGIKGSDAGTSLKTFLQNLQPTTEQQIALMKELGLVTEKGGNQFFDASGKIKPMTEIAGVLQKSLKGMSDAQKTATLETLFGSDAIRAAAVIAGEGSKGMTDLSKSINKVKAADVAATRMKNLAGQTEQLKGSAETLAIGIGSVLIPVLTDIVGKITEVVNWFTQLDSGTQKAIAITAAFVAGLLLFVGGLIKAVQAAQAMKVAMLALEGTFLANPITWYIIAIVALIAAIVLLWKNSETFRNIVTGAWEKVKAVVSAVADWFTGTLVPWFQKVWTSISEGATGLWGKMVAIWNAIKSSVVTAWTAISTFFTTIWNAIVMAVTTAINLVKTVIITVMNAILAPWRALWGLFGPLVLAVWDLIKAIVQVALAWLLVGIQKYLQLYMAAWSAVWNGIKAVASAVWNGIKAVISTVLGVIKSVITTYLNAYRAVITTVWNAIKAVINAVMNGIRAVINAVWGAIGGTVTSVVNSIRSAVSSGFNAVKSTVTSIFNSVKSTISSAMNSVKSIISGAISAIKGVFSGAGGWLVHSGQQLIQGLINGITSMVDKAAGAIKGVADKIRGFLPGSPIKEGPLKDHGWNQGRPGKQLMQGLADSIESEQSRVNRAMDDLLSSWGTGIPSSLTSGAVAASASAARTGASRGDLGPSQPVSEPNRDVTVEFKVYNPVAERSSETAVKEMYRASALGAFG